MTTWLPSVVTRTTTNGKTGSVDTTDNVTATNNRGARVTKVEQPERVTTQEQPERVTTQEQPERVTTQAQPERVTTRATAGDQVTAGTTSVTVTDDAGGRVSFTVPIRGGLFQGNPSPVCPVSP